VTRHAAKPTWSLIAKRVLIGIALVLFVYIARKEWRIQEITGCYDCGWNMRQAFFLLVGAFLSVFRSVWTAVISLLATFKVLYAIGYVTFFNNVLEVGGVGQIIRTSSYWTFKLWPEHFLQLAVALAVLALAGRIIVHAFRRRAVVT
jgi:hypothetical protein